MANEPTARELPYLLKASIVALIKTESGGDTKQHFETVFSVDEKGASMPWFVLINFLAPKFLTEKLGPCGQGWVRIYEARTLKLINRKDPTNISAIPLRVMTLDQLKCYCTRWELPIKIEDFHDLPTAVRFVKLFQDDPKGYSVQFRDYTEGKGRKYPELDEFRKKYTTSSPALEAEFDKLEDQYKNAPVPATPKDPFSSDEDDSKEPVGPVDAKPVVPETVPVPGTEQNQNAAPAPAPTPPPAQPTPPVPMPTEPAPAEPAKPVEATPNVPSPPETQTTTEAPAQQAPAQVGAEQPAQPKTNDPFGGV